MSEDRAATGTEKPPVPWTTIRQEASERGLFAVVDEAMVGRKLTPSRRRLIVGNIVMAVAKWRESFRDCGCWKTADGFALCDWHERVFRPQREEAERLAAPRAATEPLTRERLAAALSEMTLGCYHDHGGDSEAADLAHADRILEALTPTSAPEPGS